MSPRAKDADPEKAPREGLLERRLVSLGGGPYALDAAGEMYRVDAGQETVEGPDGPVVKNVAVLTKLTVRYADDA